MSFHYAKPQAPVQDQESVLKTMAKPATKLKVCHSV